MTTSTTSLSSRCQKLKEQADENGFVLIPKESKAGRSHLPSAPSSADETARFLIPVDAGGFNPPQLQNDGKELKPSVMTVSKSPTLGALMRGYNVSRGERGSNREMNLFTDCAIRFGGNGSSGTAFFPEFVLQPNSTSVTSAANFKASYDEVRCLGIDAYCRVIGTAAISTGSYAMVFDPVNDGAYTSVIGTQVAKHHTPLIAYNQPSGTSQDIQTISVNSSGYHRLSVRDLRPIAPTAGSTVTGETVGSAWVSTQDADATIGVLKMACDLVTGQAVIVDCYVIFHLEYRSRT